MFISVLCVFQCFFFTFLPLCQHEQYIFSSPPPHCLFIGKLLFTPNELFIFTHSSCVKNYFSLLFHIIFVGPRAFAIKRACQWFIAVFHIFQSACCLFHSCKYFLSAREEWKILVNTARSSLVCIVKTFHSSDLSPMKPPKIFFSPGKHSELSGESESNFITSLSLEAWFPGFIRKSSLTKNHFSVHQT